MWNRDQAPKGGAQQPASTPAIDATGRQPEERRVVAWVGKSVVFKGDVTSSEDMTIDGRVEGSIEVRDHSLTIGPDADIRAGIIARAVTVLGRVTGTITARERVEIHETGTVEGDIIAPRLAIADGALLRGRVDTEKREPHAKTARPQATATA
jgi:cytoskeletal protein CcmA (bactofilin family)